MPDQAVRPRFWTPTFILLCVAQFLAYGHHAILTPTLPLYMDHLGSSPFMVGLLLASFSSTSMLIRPLVGTWVDSHGETRVLSLSCIGLCLTVLIFVVPHVEGAFTANILRGFSWAGINTSGYAFLAAVVPDDRRGEASGYYSGIQSSSSVFFPSAALWIIHHPAGGFAPVFVLSSVVLRCSRPHSPTPAAGACAGRLRPRRPRPRRLRPASQRLGPGAGPISTEAFCSRPCCSFA